MISRSVASVEPSSTVITPSWPTASSAWLIRSPISCSREAIVPTCAMCDLPSTGIAFLASSSHTASAAAEMPTPSAAGLAPAATLRSPAATMAWASTVAVVVPSPATSLVLVATALASCAPRFSKGSSRSISRAMVTPSLVTVGPPNFLSSTTCLPRGPRVTLTASASRFTPRSSARRAFSSKLICFAICCLSGDELTGKNCRKRQRPPPRRPVGRRTAGAAVILLVGLRLARPQTCLSFAQLTTARTSRAERIR